MPDQDTPPAIMLPLVWVDVETAEARAANQLIVQHHEGEFILTFGHLIPPLLMGTPEENAEQVKQIPYVGVKVVSQISVTPAKVGEFIQAMQTVLTSYNEQQGKSGDRPAK
jgi:hypothetical protein